MALPMMTTATYTLTVPSTEKSVKYRPFLIKEEKALLLAQQSEDPVVMVDTLKGVIVSCIIDKINVDKLATFDLEYIFTQIRAKSVGENIELMFTCDQPACVDNEKSRIKIGIDLTTLKVEKNPEHTNKFDLFGDVGVVMKYPSIEVVKNMQSIDDDNLEMIFKVMAESIDYIYQGDELFHAGEQSTEELMSFVNNLTSEQFLKMQTFFTTMPKLRKEIEYDCPVCKHHHKQVLEGMQSFF
jgi:hypothetical protein